MRKPQYLVGDCSTAWTTDGQLCIDLFAEDDDGEYDEEWLDGSGLLASIVPVRTDRKIVTAAGVTAARLSGPRDRSFRGLLGSIVRRLW